MGEIWSANDVIAATSGKSKYKKWSASGVSIDTRTIKPGELFIAIKGENFDGHDFVKNALEKGAVAAIVSHKLEDVDKKTKLVQVDDTMQALRKMAVFARERTKAKIIAVTGSVGKTGVKEAIRQLLESAGKTHATKGNLNNQIGLPLSMVNMPLDTEYAVFELGMNHKGEILELTHLLKPHVAVITAIEAVHLEFLGTVENIARAKSEIFSGVVPGGSAIFPSGTPYFNLLKEEAKIAGVKKLISFGILESDDLRLVGRSGGGNTLMVNIDKKPVVYEYGLSGKHNAMNSMAVLAAIREVGVDITKILPLMKNIKETAGRGKIHEIKITGGSYCLIDDSYNASPASIRAALSNLAATKSKMGQRAIAALGDMRELGPEAAKYHSELAKDVRENNIDVVFAAGELMKNLYDNLPVELRGGYCKTSLELLPLLEEFIKPGDVLLVKGSHGSDMWKIVKEILKN